MKTLLITFFYYLFKIFPALERAARHASIHVYDEKVDRAFDNPIEVSKTNLYITHHDGEPPEE